MRRVPRHVTEDPMRSETCAAWGRYAPPGVLGGEEREVSIYEDKRVLSDPDWEDNYEWTLESLNVSRGMFLTVVDEEGEWGSISVWLEVLPSSALYFARSFPPAAKAPPPIPETPICVPLNRAFALDEAETEIKRLYSLSLSLYSSSTKSVWFRGQSQTTAFFRLPFSTILDSRKTDSRKTGTSRTGERVTWPLIGLSVTTTNVPFASRSLAMAETRVDWGGWRVEAKSSKGILSNSRNEVVVKKEPHRRRHPVPVVVAVFRYLRHHAVKRAHWGRDALLLADNGVKYFKFPRTLQPLPWRDCRAHLAAFSQSRSSSFLRVTTSLAMNSREYLERQRLRKGRGCGKRGGGQHVNSFDAMTGGHAWRARPSWQFCCSRSLAKFTRRLTRTADPLHSTKTTTARNESGAQGLFLRICTSSSVSQPQLARLLASG
ncbi:hypothetical protein B0H11DRAFT_2250263 [Mycena galericulata]|nr:hypothetical protein B0H11DRAFT_2250263 [Mycena galericulata]